MPSLIDIRRRVRAVRSTQQITKAMKMIAASRLRRAQERILSARPFAEQMLRVLSSLAARVGPSGHPLLAVREERPDGWVLLVGVTADKGLCGGFNTNVIRAASSFVLERPDRRVALALLGRKGRDFFRRRGFAARYEHVNLFAHLSYEDAQAVAGLAIEEFTTGAADAVYVVYNQFKSVLQQRVVIERVLPIPRGLFGESPGPPATLVDYIYEPAPSTIFEQLLPRYVEVQFWRALLESAAAEHAARMTAMDNATKNAGEMIDHLTLYMNKVRQAAITREIIEVVSGAEALG